MGVEHENYRPVRSFMAIRYCAAVLCSTVSYVTAQHVRDAGVRALADFFQTVYRLLVPLGEFILHGTSPEKNTVNFF